MAKQIQWKWSEHDGENKFVIMFGGLHIEQAALKLIATLVQNSGWTGALVESGISSPGTGESFLLVASITKSRQMHQVTACCLFRLQQESYNEYCNVQGADGNS